MPSPSPGQAARHKSAAGTPGRGTRRPHSGPACCGPINIISALPTQDSSPDTREMSRHTVKNLPRTGSDRPTRPSGVLTGGSRMPDPGTHHGFGRRLACVPSFLSLIVRAVFCRVGCPTQRKADNSIGGGGFHVHPLQAAAGMRCIRAFFSFSMLEVSYGARFREQPIPPGCGRNERIPGGYQYGTHTSPLSRDCRSQSRSGNDWPTCRTLPTIPIILNPNPSLNGGVCRRHSRRIGRSLHRNLGPSSGRPRLSIAQSQTAVLEAPEDTEPLARDRLRCQLAGDCPGAGACGPGQDRAVDRGPARQAELPVGHGQRPAGGSGRRPGMGCDHRDDAVSGQLDGHWRGSPGRRRGSRIRPRARQIVRLPRRRAVPGQLSHWQLPGQLHVHRPRGESLGDFRADTGQPGCDSQGDDGHLPSDGYSLLRAGRVHGLSLLVPPDHAGTDQLRLQSK